MSRKTVPIIAISDNGNRVFDSLVEAATFYSTSPPQLIYLIKTGNVFKDGKTTFDYLYE